MTNTPDNPAKAACENDLRIGAARVTALWSLLLCVSLAVDAFDDYVNAKLSLAHGIVHAAVWLAGLAIIAIAVKYHREKRHFWNSTISELQLLAHVFHESSHAVMIIAANGTVIRVNPAFTQLTGYTAEEVLGNDATLLRSSNHSPEFFAELRGILSKTGQWQGEIWNRHKNGEYFAAAYSISAVENASGAPLYYLCEMRNITRRKEEEEALLRMNDELEKRVEQRTEQLLAAKQEAERANHAKTEFLSRMSHELRTPLNAIIGFSQLLETDQVSVLNDCQRENVEEILRAGRHLLELINEVLDLARVESGHLELSPEPVAIADLVAECLALIRPLAEERGITLDTSVTTQCGFACVILADRLRLRQALLNLLSNAIKYNRDGGKVKIRCESSGNSSIRLGVSDTGPGIAAEHLPRLFLPFERIDSAYNGIEGTGIGLPLTQRLVHAMGGELNVESILGEGSTFWIELMRTECPLPQAGLPSRLVEGV